jgi:glutaredoxin-related protein
LDEQSNQILSIRLSWDKFSFAIISSYQKEVISEEIWDIDVTSSLTANLKKFFHEKIDTKAFQSANIVIEDTRYITVPMEVFDDEDIEILYYHNLPQQENETILYNTLQSVNLAVIFSIDSSAYQFLNGSFANVKYQAHISPLIEYFAARSHQGNSKKMFVNLRSNAIDTICLDRGRLMLANSYDCSTTDDRFYYIMYVWHQLNLDQELDDMNILGDVPEKEQLTLKIDKYIRHRYIFDEDKVNDIKRFAL